MPGSFHSSPESSASNSSRRTALLAIAAAGFGMTTVARAAVDAATLPESKRSRAAQYLTAKEVPGFIEANGGAQRVLFLDVRTRAEAMYVGMATAADALVPFMELQEIMSDWDARRDSYRLEPLQDFMPEVNRRLRAKGLGKSDIVIVMCRSGDRSARAADRLAEEGFTKLYSVVDGFEGDMSPEGRRSVNGWKNSGLPWSYKLDRAKMYFPQR
jgi:rhodanese-related sulfurtransferase